MNKLTELFELKCKNVLSEKEKNWFEGKLEKLKSDPSERNFFLTFGLVNRFIDKAEITFSEDELSNIGKVHPAFGELVWTKDQLCRLVLMMSLPKKSNFEAIEKLFNSADVNELVILYRGLAFLKNAKDFTLRNAEGIRTNMESVFDAIALHNPFPATYFDEGAWNQMVLKATFMQRPLFKIVNLGQRVNLNLAKIAQDFAHERWSAGRVVTPELWQLTSPFLDESLLDDLKKVFETDTELAKVAAQKVIAESNYEPAKTWLASQKFSPQPMTWEKIGEALLG